MRFERRADGCAIIVSADESRGRPLRLLFGTTNGRNLTILAAGNPRVQIVAGDRRRAFRRLQLDTAAAASRTPVWQMMAGARVFHLTASDGAGWQTARFSGVDPDRVVRRLLQSCPPADNTDVQRRQEAALALGAAERQLVNWMLLRQVNARLTPAEAPVELGARSRDLLQSFSRTASGRGRRYLNKALLDALARRSGFRFFPSLQRAGSFSGGAAPIKVGERWGMMSISGTMLVSPRFEDARGVFGGFMPVRVGAKWGIVGRTERMTVPAIHDDIDSCRQSRCAFRDGDRWGFLDPARGVVIRARYRALRRFREGYAAVRDDHGWALIDLNGREKFRVRGNIRRIYSPSEGLLVFIHRNGRRGFLDLRGRVRIPARFDRAAAFSEGLAPVRLGNLWGFADRNGRVVLRPQFHDVDGFRERLAPAQSVDNLLWGYVDRSGRWVIPPRYLKAYGFRGGRAIVRAPNPLKPYSTDAADVLRGYIDRRGNWVVPPVFQDAYIFREGLAPVKLLDRWGYLDTRLVGR